MIDCIDLNGIWEVEIEGVKEKIEVPNALETIRENKDIYGPFLFRKTVTLQKIEENKKYVLHFKGVSYQCKVCCNGQKIGEHEGIWDAFSIDITSAVKAGVNQLEVEVIKADFDQESPYYYRSVLFGFVPDIMLPFSGIWKDVELQILGGAYFENMVPSFSLEKSQVQINSKIKVSSIYDEKNLILEMKITGQNRNIEIYKTPYQGAISFKIEDIVPWSPQNPYVYKGEIALYAGTDLLDWKSFSGGFRNIKIENGEILLNEHPFYMRGVLHWGYYPEKMAPYPTYEEVKTELKKIKALGFNTIKHCLYFPPTYYYELCDEMGIVTWQELPLWLPYKNKCLIRRIFEQYPRMLDYFNQHPTVSLVSIGCELDATIGSDILDQLYETIKERDSQVIVCGNSGSSECFAGQQNSKSDIYDYHFYAELYELNQLMQEFTCGYRAKKPWVFGEFNDADTYRIVEKEEDITRQWWHNADEKINPLRKVHKGFDSDNPIYAQNEILKRYGIEAEVKDLVELSKEQMKEIRKFILETTRSFPEVQGYNITAIRDVPITTSGIFDDDGVSKVETDWMQQINGDIVVSFQKDLLRIWEYGADRFLNRDRYNYFAEENVSGKFILSNRVERDLKGSMVLKVEIEDTIVAEYQAPFAEKGNTTSELTFPKLKLPDVKKSVQGKISIELNDVKCAYKNSWPIWIYPKQISKKEFYLLDLNNQFEGMEQYFAVKKRIQVNEIDCLSKGDILVTTLYEETIEKLADRGVHLVVCLHKEASIPMKEEAFYREGVIKIEKHPIMDEIAHRGYAGIQFFGVASSLTMDKLVLEKLGMSYKSIIRRYDARKFSVSEYLIECTNHEGKIIMTTLKLNGGCGEQPNRFIFNTLGIQLLHAMLRYVN